MWEEVKRYYLRFKKIKKLANPLMIWQKYQTKCIFYQISIENKVEILNFEIFESLSSLALALFVARHSNTVLKI